MTKIVYLTLFSLIPSLALAEQCTPTPDCKSLGYTESSCPDGGGVKCPWNTSLMYCPRCEQKDPCQSCKVGMILNSDMTCSYEKLSGKTPIGVVAQQTITDMGTMVRCVGIAVALNDFEGFLNWGYANSQSCSYSAGGITGWRAPTKEELLSVYGNISSVKECLTKAGGTQFSSTWYWSSSFYGSYDDLYRVVNPVSGGTDYWGNSYSYYVRPVLAL